MFLCCEQHRRCPGICLEEVVLELPCMSAGPYLRYGGEGGSLQVHHLLDLNGEEEEDS